MATAKRILRLSKGHMRSQVAGMSPSYDSIISAAGTGAGVAATPGEIAAATPRGEYRRALTDIEHRERQVSALYELWRGVSDTETSRLLQRIAERATAAMNGHTSSLLLRERGGDTLRVAASVGLAQDVADSVTLMVGERIAGRVAASGQPILINKDPKDHPLLAENGRRVPDVGVRPEVESALCAPLMGMDGEITGVLCLSRFAPATPFTETDLRVFCLFAAQAGAAIAHTRTVEDLTRAAREAAEMEREMARNSHLAALGQLAATVAHELRNPLSSIKGAAQYLLRECDEIPTEKSGLLHDFLHIVVEEVDGLGRLTTDLLEFARPTPPQREQHRLTDIVKNEVAFLRSELETLGVTILKENYRTGRTLRADMDAAQVGRALRNLLLNAAQAATTARHSAAAAAQIIVTLDEEIVEDVRCFALSVDDNGGGVPTEMREKLWEPFFTTKARGTGLGLAQVRQVAQGHCGAVDVTDSPLLSGARFTLYLPMNGRKMMKNNREEARDDREQQ